MAGKTFNRLPLKPNTHADPSEGLSSEEVLLRKKQGLSNESATPKTKSVLRIVREHLFTLFNLLNAVMAAILFSVGSYKNMLFMIVVICNIGIGIFQELRAKFATDRLSVIAAARVTVIRDGKETDLPADDIVYGDILRLTSGNQVPVGCVVLSGEAEVNESFITGEAEPVPKGTSDRLMPGSFLTAGSCVCEAETVGKESLIRVMESGFRSYRKKNSEIIRSLKRIINVVTVLVIPYSFLFYWLQTGRGAESVNAVNTTIASVVGMIPEGLVLLVSGVMALAVYRLSKRKVLVKELYSVESLARTDVLCLDKTGTLTDGLLTVRGIRTAPGVSEDGLLNMLTSFAAHMQENGTVLALRAYCEGRKADELIRLVPFSSARKYSRVVTTAGSYVMGAPEYVIPETDLAGRELAGSLSSSYRVIALASVPGGDDGSADIPENRVFAGLVLLSESLRPNAAQTISYFQEQDVTIKVISGDNPVTVSAIARAAGIRNADRIIDMTSVPDQADYASLVRDHTVFGRVSPAQKKMLIHALREAGHTVGMTGDGVNDVLALREADVSIAINDGSSAARNVADMIMLDSDYSSLPQVVLEGRNAINNLERSSSLFLVKTIYSILLGILFLFVSVPYPFVPIQITLINALTVGFPSVVLALLKSHKRVNGSFLRNAFLKALPIGLSVTASVLFLSLFGPAVRVPQETVSMFCAASVALCTLFGVFWVSRPLNRIKAGLLILCTAGYIGAVVLFGKFFEMKGDWSLVFPSFLLAVAVDAFVFAAVATGIHLYNRYLDKKYTPRIANMLTTFFRTLRQHRIGSCSADSSFFMLLSLVPLLILLLSLTSFFSLSTDSIIQSLTPYFPSVVDSMFDRLISSVVRNANGLIPPIAGIVVLFLASKSVYALIRGLNTIRGYEEKRPISKVRALSVVYTVCFLVILLVTLVLIVFSQSLSSLLAGYAPFLSGLFGFLSRFRVLFGIVYLSLFFTLTYKFLPAEKEKFAEQLPGGFLAAAGWTAFSYFFAAFIDYFFGSSMNIYGTLAAVAVFMLWLYVCLYILFLGAEFNRFLAGRVFRKRHLAGLLRQVGQWRNGQSD